MENVHRYGRPNGRPLTETRAHEAHTHKGRLRSRMANELPAVHARAASRSPSGAPRTTTGRAVPRSRTWAT